MQHGAASSHAIARTADRRRKEGRFAEAIALCLQQLRVRPTYISARVVLGRAYMESGDHAGAEEEFRRVIEMSPENLRARKHLGEICASQGRRDEAIRHYEAALNLVPLDREFRTSLIRLRGAGHSAIPTPSFEPTNAIAEASPDLSPSGLSDAEENLFATETLADLYASQGLDDRAAAIYQRLLDERPFSAGIHEKLVSLRERRPEATGPLSPVLADMTSSELGQRGSEPAFVENAAPVFELPEALGAISNPTSVSMSGDQMVVDELERWLQGVRRYRQSTAKRW